MNKNILLFVSLLFSGFVFGQDFFINSQGTVNTCTGTLYDSGGATGNYQSYEDYTMTICSDNGGFIKLNFTSFETEFNYDKLSIYDGVSSSASVIVNNASGSALQGQTVVSTGTCLTLVWHSDTGVTKAGWVATINCLEPCQDFTVDIVNTSVPITNTDSMWIDVCQETTITFTGAGNYPNNNNNYVQSDATTEFIWTIGSESGTHIDTGIGMTEFTYTFQDEGGYFVILQGKDENNCTSDVVSLRVRVSITPDINGLSVAPDEICPGETIQLTGNGSITPNKWEMEFPLGVSEETFLPDGSGIHYTTTITHNAFTPGQTLTHSGELLAICANMEHTYMGDLSMYLECPNGQTMTIFTQGGGNTILGEPVGEGLPIDGNSSNTAPGIGYDYCWTPSSTNGSIHDSQNWQNVSPYTDPIGNVSTANPINQLISQDYEIEGSWGSLIGCPLNGEWTIHITDHLGLDNGWIFSWQLIFDQSVVPQNLWTFENTYDYADAYWTGDGVTSNTNGDATATPTVSGTSIYTFHAVDDFGCEYLDSVSVYVRSADDCACCVTPTANAGVDEAICSNTYTYTLNATLSKPMNTVVWTQISGPGQTNFNGQQTSTNPTITVNQPGVYQYEVTEQNICPDCTDKDTVQITFYPKPTSTFSNTFINCFGDATTLNYTGNATAAATYVWDFDGGSSTGAGQGPIDVSWTTAGTYNVSLTVSENGCTSESTTVSIVVPEQLTQTLTHVDDPCFGSCEGSAETTVQGGTLPYTYSWGATNVNNHLCAGNYTLTVTDNNGCQITENYVIGEGVEIVINSANVQNLSCFNANDGSISLNVTGGTGTLTFSWSDGGTGAVRNNLAAGNYTVVIKDANDCTVTEQYTLTQPAQLSVGISPNQAHCQGTVATVSAQAVGGTLPYTYHWNSGNGFFPGGSEISVSPDQTTVYMVYVEDANGCISSTQSMTMTISPKMVMNLTTQDNRCFQSCDGEALLTVEGGIPPFNYSWSSDNGLLENLCAGTYNVTVTDILGCSVDTSFIITEPPQMFANTYTQPATCFGSEDGLAWVEATGGLPDYTYLWPNGSNNDSVTLSAGTYTVTVSDINDCRVEIDAVIEQPDAVHAVELGGDRYICKSNSTMLNAYATGGTPYYNFHWTGSDGSSYIVSNPEVSPDETTVYTLSVVDAHGCVSNMPSVTIGVYPDLEIISLASAYDSICPGDSAVIDVDVSGGNGGPYELTLQNGEVVSSPFIVTPEETTDYIVTLTDDCGTPTVTDTIKITVMPKPQNVFISDKVEGCPPFNVQFSETSPDEGQTYLWNFGDSGFGYNKNPSHVYEQGGLYDVTLTVTSAFGCKNKRVLNGMIHVFDKPTADFYVDNNYVSILDAEVQFFNVSELADSSYWFFSDGDSSHLANPIHWFDALGQHEVMLVVESEHGCYDTIRKFINVKDVLTFFAPTAFTPNGDGNNDFFMVSGNGINPNEFELRIYDRWGELIFKTEIYNPNNPVESGWNGKTQNGDDLLPNGVYYWYCKFKDFTGVLHEKEGRVNIIR